MDSIRTNRILPAYIENVCDNKKVAKYAKKMKQNDELTGHHGFPPILGYYDTITKDDFGDSFNYASEENSELITKEHLGITIFRVTDGNHRFLAAIKSGIWVLETELDKSGFIAIQHK